MPNTPDHPILVGFKKLSTYFLTPAMLVGIIWYYATSTESNKHVQFTDPVIKHKTEEHVKNSPNEAEQLKLNPEKFEFLLLGNVEKDDELFKIAYKYIRNVSLLENRYNYAYDTAFTEEDKRSYYTLLNQF